MVGWYEYELRWLGRKLIRVVPEISGEDFSWTGPNKLRVGRVF